jgi:uncharacterized protein YbjT (DUF2867 family)
MNYLVTGGTGLIGRYTIENLLKRGGPVEKLKKLFVMQWAGDKLLDALQFPRELDPDRAS